MARPKRVPVPEPSPIMLFPTKGGKLWGLSQAQVDAWQSDYAFDVLSDCRRALNWCKTNPTRLKQHHTMPRFFVNWLNSTAAKLLKNPVVPRGGDLRWDGWTCPHVEPCNNRTTCNLRTAQGRPLKNGAAAP